MNLDVLFCFLALVASYGWSVAFNRKQERKERRKEHEKIMCELQAEVQSLETIKRVLPDVFGSVYANISKAKQTHTIPIRPVDREATCV